MAQRIVVDCDVHGKRDESVAGLSYDIVIRRQGEGFMFLTVDMCEVCAKPLADLWVELAEVGRTFDDSSANELGTAVGKPTKRKQSASGSLARATAQAPAQAPARTAPVVPPSDDAQDAPTGSQSTREKPFKCPACDYAGPTDDALRSHVRTAHNGVTLAELRGEPLPFACPDCESAFSSPQGLGAHRATLHGYRSPSREA